MSVTVDKKTQKSRSHRLFKYMGTIKQVTALELVWPRQNSARAVLTAMVAMSVRGISLRTTRLGVYVRACMCVCARLCFALASRAVEGLHASPRESTGLCWSALVDSPPGHIVNIYCLLLECAYMLAHMRVRACDRAQSLVSAIQEKLKWCCQFLTRQGQWRC